MKDEIKHNYKIFKAIKYILVVIAFISLVVVSYLVLINQNNKISQNNINENNNQESKNSSKFEVGSPSLSGLSLEHGPYYVKAEGMKEFEGEISFIKPWIKLMIKHYDWMNANSERANLVREDNHFTLYEKVKGNFNQQYYLESEQLEILAKESIVKSNQYSYLYTQDYNLKSEKGFIVYAKDKKASFHGDIDARIIDPQDNKVTKITSKQFDISGKRKTGSFLGDVVMIQDDIRVESDKMVVVVNKISNKVEQMHLYGRVRIISDKQTVTSEYGEYIIATKTLVLKNNVKLYKDNNVVTGKVLHYDFKLRKANLVGDVSEDNKKRVKAVIIPASIKNK